MKKYLLNLLETAIDNNKVKSNSDTYDIAFLKELVDRVTSDKEYFYTFLLDLSSDLIKDITMLIEPSGARDSFVASLIYLKKLIEINEEEDVKIPLSTNQEELLYQLLELIKKIIEKDDQVSDEKAKYLRKNGRKLETLYNKLKKNKQLDIDDYDLVEKLILDNETGNVNKKLNETMDYLNEYNYKLLPEFVEKPVVEEIPEEEPEVIEEVQEVVEEPKVEEIPEASIEEVENKPIPVETPEEETDQVVVNVSKSIDFDIFNPQSFVYETSDEPPKKRGRKKKEEVEEIQEEIPVRVEEPELVEPIPYDKAKLDRFKDELMDEKSLNDLFNFFKVINLSDDTIGDLIHRCTPIFFAKNIDSFKDNVGLALSYGANIEHLIENNITFFYNSFEYNKSKIELLAKKGLNISMIFSHKPQILAISLDKLLKNLDVLKRYNLEVLDDDYDSISIIAASNLGTMIDTFIEAGFSTYLATDGLKNIRSLIIKRIFYAHKNELDVWKENISLERINEEYEAWINKELVILDEEDINYLVSENQLLEQLEESKRPNSFADPKGAQVKRKYEFKFDNIIISRLKTYSVFKVLVNHEVEVHEALLYALTYNLNVDSSDYELIKNEILGK